MARIILNNNRTPAAAAAAANDRACVRRMKYRRNDPRGITGGPGEVRSKSKIGRTRGLRDTASRMKFRERYANQTASIRRSGVAAAALSRSANLPGAAFRLGPPSPQSEILRPCSPRIPRRRAPREICKSGESTTCTREQPRSEEKDRRKRRRRRKEIPLEFETRTKRRDAMAGFSNEEKGATYVTTRRALES